MPVMRFVASVLGAAAIISTAVAQELDVFRESVNVKDASEDSGDLKALKKGKWIVISVERDGKTLPAQFGQKPGDIITFKTKDGLMVFY